MLLETLRAATDWLKDTTYGVAAIAAQLPRDTGEAAPVTLKLITDETRDGRVAIGELPENEKLPCLVGSLRPLGGSAPEIELGQVGGLLGQGTVTTFWQYADRFNAEGARANERITTDAYRFLRAALKSFGLLVSQPAGEAARVRLGSQIIGVEGMSPVPWFARTDSSLLIGGAVVRFTVHDSWQP